MSTDYSSENLKTLRQLTGMSRKALLEKMEEAGVAMHATTLKRIEDGEQPMKANEAARFAELFGVGLDDFITRPMDERTAEIQSALLRHHEAMEDFQRSGNRMMSTYRELSQVCKKTIDENGVNHQTQAYRDAFDYLAISQPVIKDVRPILKKWGLTENDSKDDK